MFCTLLFNFANYVFSLLRILIVMCMYYYCYVRSVLGIVLLCCSVCCLCVKCTVLLPPGVNPIAVKYIIPYIISYHIISYHIISYHKELIIEIQCMWNVKVKAIPVIKDETGSNSKSLR